ncbi:hypothetical protein HNP99_000844 [Flavobacterium sp. 28A]|nr:hypothetical protein [Flavobacterium sp. 28A]NRT14504.1 hypothetical protein [Flavobacterium sp. 28A]
MVIPKTKYKETFLSLGAAIIPTLKIILKQTQGIDEPDHQFLA